MKKNKLRIPLNDENKFIYLFIDEKDKISIETDTDIKFLQPHCKINYKKDKTTIKVLGKDICEISNGEIKIVGQLTSTEIRALTSSESVENVLLLLKHRFNSEIGPKTELHTHLIEILNGDDLIEFFREYFANMEIYFKDNKLYFPISNIDINQTNNNIYICKVKDLNKEQMDIIKKEVSISLVGQSIPENLGEKNKNRRMLLNLCANELERQGRDVLSSEYKQNDYLIYLLLRASLKKIKDQGIKYAEISYSNIRTLQFLAEQDYSEFIDDNFSFSLLKSIDRNDTSKAYRQAMNDKNIGLYYSEVIKGIDIMGVEEPLNDFDYMNIQTRNPKCSYHFSFYYKLLQLIPNLNKIPGSILRLHAGEYIDCTYNVFHCLNILDRVVNDCNLTLPPPQIRIGHAINVNKNNDLIRLLKKYNCIVEFNLSSNYALGNISYLEELPIKYYLKNGIKYVLSTDGGGMYLASGLQEANVFKSIIDDNSYTITEESYLNSIRRF